MGLTESILMYLVVGIAVAVAVAARSNRNSSGQWAVRVVTAWIFWPLYLPLLLVNAGDQPEVPNLGTSPRPAVDPLRALISQVEGELDTALASLDGWAEDVLVREQVRISELKEAWTAQAERIREMDRLLARPEFALAGDADPETTPEAAPNDKLSQCRAAREAHLQRLHAVRAQAHADLLTTLAWVRELVTMIHLARYTGAPASRAEELVAQIAAAIEGLTEVSAWDSTTPAGNPPPHTRLETV